MVTSGKPTKHTKHIDICWLSLHKWIKHKFVGIEHIKRNHNIPDPFKKARAYKLFHCHLDVLMVKLLAAFAETILDML